MLAKRFLGIIFGDNKEYEREKKKYEGLPRNCRHCELLGMCRRPKEEGWKCYRGCLIINARNERRDSHA